MIPDYLGRSRVEVSLLGELLLYQVQELEPLAHYMIIEVMAWLNESQIHL